MKALLLFTALLGATAHAAQTTGTPLAKCFGYTLVQYGSDGSSNFFMRPSDGNHVNGGKDLSVYHESVPDLDAFTTILPSGSEFILTRSFELGPNMQGQMIYHGSFKTNGQQTPAKVCETL